MKKAVTLSEVILALAILIVGLTSLLVFFANCIILNGLSRNFIVGGTHAQYVMEEIRDEDSLSNITTKIENGDWDWNISDIESKGLEALTGESIDTYCCSGNCTLCLVSCLDSADDPLGVVVKVEWQDRSGRDMEIELPTLMTNDQCEE